MPNSGKAGGCCFEVMSALEEALREGESLASKYIKGRKGRLPDGEEARPNGQAFEESEENQRPKRVLQELGQDLHNAKAPNLEIISEKPEHRFIAYLRAQGMSVMEIFKQFGGQTNEKCQPVSGTGEYSYAWLTQICRQPWFQARVIAIMEAAGMDVVQQTLKAECLDSVHTLVELRDNAKTESVRASAANSILDRFLGKPTQKIETKSEIKHGQLEDDASKLQEELDQVESELKARGLS
jgi:hypothetical protein